MDYSAGQMIFRVNQPRYRDAFEIPLEVDEVVAMGQQLWPPGVAAIGRAPSGPYSGKVAAPRTASRAKRAPILRSFPRAREPF